MILLTLIAPFAFAQSSVETKGTESYTNAIRAGDARYQRGQPTGALAEWTRAYELAKKAGDRSQTMDALARRAEAYASLGYFKNATEDLEAAIALADAAGDSTTKARLQGRLGNVQFLAGHPKQSESNLRACLAYAKGAGEIPLQASTLNDLGNLLASRGMEGAGHFYMESVALARKSGDAVLVATVQLNRARHLIENGKTAAGESQLDAAMAAFRALDDSSLKAAGLLGAARLLTELATRPERDRTQHYVRINDIYLEAESISRAIGDARALSYALGYRGELYEQRRRWRDALPLTRQALFEAQQADAPEIVYLWQWQLARLHKAMDEPELSLADYRQATMTLQQLRRELLSGGGAGSYALFKDAGTVFLEHAELLLTLSETRSTEAETQAMLLEARQTMELAKTAEIENYFQDDCVAALQSTATSVDALSAHAAAVYPILLPNRVELLVSLPGKMLRVTSPTARDEVMKHIANFRYLLGKHTFEYRRPAQSLYAAFIAPIEGDLADAGVDTLVFVPDGALRTIPFAALYDGERHLVEKYALAITPGLTLLDPRPLSAARLDLLLGGLSEGVQGFSPLPHVTTEIEELKTLYGGEVFENEDFVTVQVERALDSRPFTVVHLATHAKFEPDARSSFLLTYDGRLSMDQLENLVKLSRFREEPVELLTLSACDTAVGDERAALGLAGVAIKAGARSALASLWLVNDQAASVLVSEFYRQLTNEKVSKAQALQHAQISLINDRRYHFPVYWAPFLMIGNWL